MWITNCTSSTYWTTKSFLPSEFNAFVIWCSVIQSCPTLRDPMDCSLPGSSVHGDSPGKNTGVGCHFLLQEIFPTQGSNPCLLHLQEILYHQATREAPIHNFNWVSLITIYWVLDIVNFMLLSIVLFLFPFKEYWHPWQPVKLNSLCHLVPFEACSPQSWWVRNSL